MICLVFTKTKLLAGISLKSPDLLPIKGNAFIDYGEKSMVDSLKLHLPDIKQAYASYARKSGMQPEVTIPIAVAFPDDIQGDKAQEREANHVVEFLGKDQKSFQVLHKDLLGTSFLHSVTPDPKVRKEPCILLNALDKHLDLYYLNTNGKFNGNTYVELKEIGIEIGQQNLLKELTSEFKKAGIQLGPKDLEHIENMAKNPPANYIFELRKTSGPVRIKAELALTPRRYEDIISVNRNNLSSRLNQNNLNAQGISKVVLMGEFLENSVLKDYFNKDLQIGSKLLSLDTKASESDYKAIVKGLAALTQEAMEVERKRKEEEAKKKRAEAERKRKEEEERKRKEEEERKRKAMLEAERKRKEEEERKRKAMLEAERKRKEEEMRRKAEEERKRKEEEERRRKAEEERKRLEAEKKAKQERDAFIRTVQTNCTDPSKEAEYIERYAKEGAKFNIPKEVISWTIKETLSNLKLHGQPISQPSVPVAAAPTAIPAADKNLLRLYDLFDVEAVLIDSEFSTKKVVQIDSGTKKIIRIIDRASMGNPVQMENFKKLYKKELKYYKALSEIHTVQEGMYYSRDFVDSVSLKDYIRKIGLEKKTRVEQLKSADLKLLLQVFREVNTLEVSHASLDDDNIQIIENRKWTLQRDIEIRFSGFTSVDATQEEMELKLHQLFGKLLEEKVYADFREKFNI